MKRVSTVDGLNAALKDMTEKVAAHEEELGRIRAAWRKRQKDETKTAWILLLMLAAMVIRGFFVL